MGWWGGVVVRCLMDGMCVRGGLGSEGYFFGIRKLRRGWRCGGLFCVK